MDDIQQVVGTMLNSILRKAGKYLIGLSDRKPAVEAPNENDRGRHFSEQARRISSRRDPNDRKLLAASIRFVDLREIKHELGVNWVQASGAAYRIVEDTIAMNLSADDIYARHGQDVFVVCFASGDREDVETRMRDIVEKIKRALSKGNSESFRVAHDVADIILVDSDEVPLIDTIANSLRRVRDEAENAAKIWREHLLRSASIRYKPIWSPSKKVVALHRAVLDEDTGRRTMQRLSSLSSVDEMLTVLFELDCLILSHVTSALHDLVSGGGRTQLIVPVNFKSLTVGTQRKRYLKLCADIPSAYRRFLLFEICDIPPGTPGGRVIDLIVPLNQSAHGTIIEASASSAVDLVDSVGSAVVGVVTRADQFSGTAVEVSARMNRLVTDLKASNMKVFLRGVNTRELVHVARATGIDWIDGSCVAALTKELKSLYHWNVG